MVQAFEVGGSGKAMPDHGNKPKTTTFVYYLSFMAVMGGFLFGYDTGVVSSAMLFIPQAMNLDYTWTELIVSITVGFCGLFSLVAGWSSERLGRRMTILIASGMFTVGAVLLTVAVERTMLLIGRMIVGAAVGLASMTVPVYLAECCPAHLRGTMVTGFQFMITFGLLIASILGGAFSYIDPTRIGWRLMMAVGAIPGLIQFVGFFFLPESPRWLMSKGKDEEAAQVLQRIYGDPDWVQFEIVEIEENLEKLKLDQETIGDGLPILQMLKIPHTRKALILGCALQGFQQLAGVNTLMYYTASVIKMSGIRDATQAIWMSCLITGVNFFFTFVPIVLVERVGRRKLLLGSMTGVIFSLIFLAVSFLMINISAPNAVGVWNNGTVTSDLSADFSYCKQFSNCDDCVTMEECGFCFPNNHSQDHFGWCLPIHKGEAGVSEVGPCNNSSAISVSHGWITWAWNFCPKSSYSWMPILGMVVYICFFASGMAPMPWVINSEIYPYWARSTGIACATATNWFANLIISQTFLTLTEQITKYGAFFLYTGITVIGWIVFYFAVPETKGVRIEQVDQLFSKKSDKISPAEK